MSEALRSHGLRHARLPCPSLSPGVCSNPCPFQLHPGHNLPCFMRSKALLLLPILSPVLESFQRRRHGVLFSRLDPSRLTLCGRGLSDDFPSWGTSLGFLGGLPRSDPSTLPFWLPMAYSSAVLRFPWRGAVQWLTVPAPGSTLLTGLGWGHPRTDHTWLLAVMATLFPVSYQEYLPWRTLEAWTTFTIALSADSPHFKLI